MGLNVHMWTERVVMIRKHSMLLLLSLLQYGYSGTVPGVNGDLDISKLSLEDAIKFLQLAEMHELEETIAELKTEKIELDKNHAENVEKIKKENEEILNALTGQLQKAKQEVTNQDVLLKFMKNILYYNEAKGTTCMDTVQA